MNASKGMRRSAWAYGGKMMTACEALLALRKHAASMAAKASRDSYPKPETGGRVHAGRVPGQTKWRQAMPGETEPLGCEGRQLGVEKGLVEKKAN